jgi:hypothetical protein
MVLPLRRNQGHLGSLGVCANTQELLRLALGRLMRSQADRHTPFRLESAARLGYLLI